MPAQIRGHGSCFKREHARTPTRAARGRSGRRPRALPRAPSCSPRTRSKLASPPALKFLLDSARRLAVRLCARHTRAMRVSCGRCSRCDAAVARRMDAVVGRTTVIIANARTPGEGCREDAGRGVARHPQQFLQLRANTVMSGCGLAASWRACPPRRTCRTCTSSRRGAREIPPSSTSSTVCSSSRPNGVTRTTLEQPTSKSPADAARSLSLMTRTM